MGPASLTPAGLILGAALVVLLTPVSSAAPAVAASTSWTAPYAAQAAALTPTHTVHHNCASIGRPIPLYVHRSTGRAGVGLSTSAPACANRFGNRHNEAQLIDLFWVGVPVTAPTGVDNVSLNVTLTWNVTWNVTIPSCAHHPVSAFTCEVVAKSALSGYSTLNRSGSAGSIPRLHESLWSLAPSGGASYTFLCHSRSNSSCSSTSTTATFGRSVGSMTANFTARGLLNASLGYFAGLTFEISLDAQTYQTHGGTMLGGTALATAAVTVQINSVSVT